MKYYSFKPKGNRDVYWCGQLNEPMFPDYGPDGMKCAHCGRVYQDNDDYNEHPFMIRVYKALIKHGVNNGSHSG